VKELKKFICILLVIVMLGNISSFALSTYVNDDVRINETTFTTEDGVEIRLVSKEFADGSYVLEQYNDGKKTVKTEGKIGEKKYYHTKYDKKSSKKNEARELVLITDGYNTSKAGGMPMRASAEDDFDNYLGYSYKGTEKYPEIGEKAYVYFANWTLDYQVYVKNKEWADVASMISWIVGAISIPLSAASGFVGGLIMGGAAILVGEWIKVKAGVDYLASFNTYNAHKIVDANHTYRYDFLGGAKYEIRMEGSQYYGETYYDDEGLYNWRYTTANSYDRSLVKNTLWP